MSTVNVNINEAAVTAVKKFTTFKGVGADFYIEARSSKCTVYLQVVLYDAEATRALSSICEGDSVTVAGDLKDKPYHLKNGAEGHSLVVERPAVFMKLIRRNSEPQLLQQADETINTTSSDDEYGQEVNAVTASDASYYEQFNDYSDIENPWEYEPEELEKIYKHIEERKKKAYASSTANESNEFYSPAETDTVLQKPNAETALQYPLDTSEDDDGVPF